MVSTVRLLADAGIFDAECVPWVPIALLIALAAVAMIGAFVLRREPGDGDGDVGGDELDPDPEG
ncbi:hypothetical protein GCM10027515_02830 [Schumannella luteola]|uniref:Uncharacterized protein n=1 Tax=Schumannella luteola TaxID=472059 RepID=A0A852YB50_9MICO|nr:hypothetical protein [Schumannella luteola]NYG98580.1 hypothetical protein [Schumannella luteola]TPX02559.1 hypothetical protein FJ656_21425 [Schumannella luteola]